MKKRILILSVMLLSFAPPVFALGENTQDSASLTGVNCAAQVEKSDGSITGGHGSQSSMFSGTTVSTAADAQLQ